LPLDTATEQLITKAIGAINAKGYLKVIDPVRQSKLQPLLSGQGFAKVFRIPDNFLVPYSLAHREEPDKPKAAAATNGMTTAKKDSPDEREIYFNGPPKLGTVIHELFHWLSHATFFAAFHDAPGPNVGMLDEGITEFLTRKLTPENRIAHYQAEYLEVKHLCSRDGQIEQRILLAYFKGDQGAITWLKNSVRADRRRAVVGRHG
jgi:hypothetical protein